MSVRNLTLLVLAFLCPAPGYSAGARQEKRITEDHFENTKWDAAKPPVVEEPALALTNPSNAWQAASAAPSALCDSKRSLIGFTDGNAGSGTASNAKSRLEAIGVKEKNIEVRGAFLRFRTCLLPEPEAGRARGQGWIDMSSWDSGLTARDRRVARYVFGVEQADQMIVPFDFEITPWKLPPPKPLPSVPAPEDSWEATLKAKVPFRGTNVEVESSVRVIRSGGNTQLVSKKDVSFRFMNPAVEKGFQEMMALCNHHFLATYSLVRFDLLLSKKKR